MPEHTFSFINAISSDDLDDVRGSLTEQGYDVIEFDGTTVRDKASFLDQADRDLPRPADLHPHNWDAFADTLSDGLGDLTNDAAIVWTDSGQMVEGDLQNFLIAFDIITTAARDAPVPVLVVLVGGGPGYRTFGSAD